MEGPQVAGTADDTNRAGPDLFADRLAADEDCAVTGQLIAFETPLERRDATVSGRAWTMYSLRSSAILRPFDVQRHRVTNAARIMLLDANRVVGKGQYVAIVNAEPRAFGLRGRFVMRGAPEPSA